MKGNIRYLGLFVRHATKNQYIRKIFYQTEEECCKDEIELLTYKAELCGRQSLPHPGKSLRYKKSYTTVGSLKKYNKNKENMQTEKKYHRNIMEKKLHILVISIELEFQNDSYRHLKISQLTEILDCQPLTLFNEVHFLTRNE
jgi:hypothetical protein